MSRIIIFTGKGGVGKTSVAAAHAVKAAKDGLKTLIVSTDMAHNLSDLFMRELNEEPKEVLENLDGLEIDPNYEMNSNYKNISVAFKELIPDLDNEDSDALEDIVVFPGIEELFSLIKIKDLYEKNIYDLIIVDCAPTGETLSLLKFPELLSWYMEKLFPVGKVALKVLRPIGKVAFKIDLPDKKALSDIERLYINLAQLQKLLKNQEICSIRIVTIPEKMVVEETKRSYMYLNLYNFNVDGIYINRIIPSEVNNNFFDTWKQIQKKYIEELDDVFFGIPTYKIKWYDSDVNGVQGLEKVIKDSFGDRKIFDVLKTTENETFKKVDQGYLLDLYIPFIDKSNFDLYQSDTEVIIKIGNFKRNIPMPDVIRKYSIDSAKLENERLKIIFK
ncbi:ArsA family ATPase [Clostridium bornimense]|uniref:ArsA family ATPase n=1 Tax=Clostridium bornimense TaxID=1216932 RepID=UPI001C1101E3|nr:ArsA family ATPase [Clostridium bornimense]MBU5317296.1 ArsA family ATPase [Clostridium bornimense]